jgi:hypothetical protein
MAGKSRARHQAERDQAEDEQNSRIDDLSYQQQSQQAPAPQQAPAAAQAPSMTDQLNQLATLHQQGALTDSEFTAAKAKLFGT